MGSRILRWSLTVASVLLIGGSLYAQSLTWLTLGGAYSVARSVSANGTVVVGEAINAGGSWHAFRWANGAMQDLGTLGGYHSYAYGVSADGNVVVGWSYSITDDKIAFRWIPDGEMQDVNPFDSPLSYAYGVSADGRVVVGSVSDASGHPCAFRWTLSGGMEDLSQTYARVGLNLTIPGPRHCGNREHLALPKKLDIVRVSHHAQRIHIEVGPNASALKKGPDGRGLRT